MPEFKDLTGKQIGYWTILFRQPNHYTKSGNHYTVWRCRCACGAERDVFANSLLSGASTSCGCATIDKKASLCAQMFTTHGESKTRLYRIWAGMKKRCLNENSSNYKNYGARGIEICGEWMSFEPFKSWAIKNGYNDTLTIDRVNVNGNYCPENCRWATVKEQCNNRRSSAIYEFNGEGHTIAEWADIVGKSYKLVQKHIKLGTFCDKDLKQIHST